jgi:hypothetical protein
MVLESKKKRKKRFWFFAFERCRTLGARIKEFKKALSLSWL